MTTTYKNWSGNLTYHANRIHQPETVEQVQEIVANSQKVKALGSRHSFNTIADTDHDLISTEKLNRLITIDPDSMTVTVEGGMKYGDLAVQLHREGYAIHNLASLPHISVAGAISTATHGSGNGNGSLAAIVRGLEIVTANGEILRLERGSDPRFEGAVVGLGGVGLVTKVTLDIQPTFEVRQVVYQELPFDQLQANFDAVTGAAYSVSLFTDWQDGTVNQVWQKHRVRSADESFTMPPDFYGAGLAAKKLHPLAGVDPQACTEQGGVPSAWHDRLSHFKMEFTPSHGAELQAEYFVPRDLAIPAIDAMIEIRQQVAAELLITELRTIAADDLWMSPCYQQDCLAIHFTLSDNWPGVQALLPHIEAALQPFGAKPHWGKLFTMQPSRLQALYPKLADFRNLLTSLDPNGKFHNAFLETNILA